MASYKYFVRSYILLILVLICNTSANYSFAQENKNPERLLYVFTGSDWCANCQRLEKLYLADPSISSLIVKEYKLILVDFPRKKKNQLSDSLVVVNKDLLAKYNEDNYFPKLVRVEAGEVVKTTLFPESKEQLLTFLK